MVNGGYPYGPDGIGDAFGPDGPTHRLWQVFWFCLLSPMTVMIALPLILGVTFAADATDALVGFRRLLFAASVVDVTPAALTGAGFGFKEVYLGGSGWRSAIAASAGASCVLLLDLRVDRYRGAELAFCLVVAFARLVCQWLAKKWFFAPPCVSEIKL